MKLPRSATAICKDASDDLGIARYAVDQVLAAKQRRLWGQVRPINQTGPDGKLAPIAVTWS
jgi:hypothetical protein